MAKLMTNHKPPISTGIPMGLPGSWSNITEPSTIDACSKLIAASTGLSAPDQQKNVQELRTAIWQRGDQLVAIAFHSLYGPTDKDNNSKFCVCAGVDESLDLTDKKTKDEVYQSIRGAVIAFANQNSRSGKAYIVLGQGQSLSGSRIDPIFQLVLANDVSSEQQEKYTQPRSGRWPPTLTTYKLKTSGA
jgi:hypothetical protein